MVAMQKFFLRLTAGIAGALCCAGLVSAQTLNKCVDANGKTVYLQTPCPSGSKASTVKTDPAATPRTSATARAARPTPTRTSGRRASDGARVRWRAATAAAVTA